MPEAVSFDLRVSMQARWVPAFLGMLRLMESLGKLGSSKFVSFYADGDGDFHPVFSFNSRHPEPDNPRWVKELETCSEIALFDAG